MDTKDLLTILIAIITILILYQQWKTNHYKYKLDLYDKRFKVYNALRKFLGLLLQKGIENVTQEEIREYNINIKESLFLFDKDIQDYLELINKKTIDFQHIHQTLVSSKTSVEGGKQALEIYESLSNWFLAQLDESRNKFLKYLKIEKIFPFW